MLRVLGVFAKEPQPGHVKTRLAQVFGAEQAARLYDAFLRDLLLRLEPLPMQRVVAYTPDTARGFFQRLVGDRFELAEQSPGDLGARMLAFFEQQFGRGASQVVLIGSDTPDLPIARIEQAFAELGRRETVLGPCDDGGYYLVGAARLVPEMFTGIDWGRSDVFLQTVRRISRLPVRLAVLERWYDVDRAEDLSHLSALIGAARRAGREPGLPHTEAVLRSLAAIA